jgi:DNA repair protein RecO (recombination protein O)
MTEERATGIVLRTYPLTETSLIVHWLTAELGRVSTVAKGARRPASPFRGKLDLFYHCEISFARSRRSDLHTLREVAVREMHEALRQDLGWLRQAAYGAALIEQATETETPLPGLFALYREFLQHLPQHPPEALTVFAFEMKVLAELGLTPNLAEARLSAGCRQILEKCLAVEMADLARLKLSPAQTAELRHFLHGFLVFHLGRIPASRGAAAN